MAKIQLYQKRELTDLYATVDDEDLDAISGYRWSVFRPRGSLTLYARSGSVYLHRAVMRHPKGKEIDHIDGNGLNNEKINLRIVTHAENMRSAGKLPGRYGNPTIEELDRELAEFEAAQNAE